MWLWFILLALVDELSSAPESGYWLAGPKGHYYLIGRGQESWINAREYCLARNADLISVDDGATMTWVLQHFMPSPRNPGFIQVGLFRSFYPPWRWLSGKALGELEKINATGDDQCGVLSLKDATWLSVACDKDPEVLTRFICERSGSAHAEQQKTDNGLWSHFERLFEYFGIGGGKKNDTVILTTEKSSGVDLEDLGPLAKDIEHAERLLDLEGSGTVEAETKSSVTEEELLPLSQTTTEASGADISKELTEGSGEEGSGWIEKKPAKAHEIEQDFNVDDSHISIENVPIPEKKDDCNPIIGTPETSADLLAILKQFLNRATHSDFQHLVEDDSHSLVDRLLRGISDANAREFGVVHLKEDEKLTDSEREMLFEELGKLLVSDEKERVTFLKTREEFF